VEGAAIPAGIIRVEDRRHRFLGQALWSPKSEIRLRLLSRSKGSIDAAWWAERIAEADRHRSRARATASAYRVVHGEGDGLPSLIVDRYGEYVVAQLLSAGLESVRDDVLHGIRTALNPRGVLLRNDASVRRHEGLPIEIVDAEGEVPDGIEV